MVCFNSEHDGVIVTQQVVYTVCLLEPASIVRPCFWLHHLARVSEHFAGLHFLEEHAMCCHSGIKYMLINVVHWQHYFQQSNLLATHYNS
jgi:hypothetical protein